MTTNEYPTAGNSTLRRSGLAASDHGNVRATIRRACAVSARTEETGMAESDFVVVEENIGTDTARGRGVVEAASGLLEAAVAALPVRAETSESDEPRRRRVVRRSRRAAQRTAVEVPVRTSHPVRRAVVVLTVLTALVGAVMILRR